MASARELLEQADALMQRNRARAGADIPVLTDAVADPVLANVAANADVPVLTDAVVESETAPVAAASVAPPVNEDNARTPALQASPFEVLPDEPKPHMTPAMAPAMAPAQDPLEPALVGLPTGNPIAGDPSDWLVMDTIDPSLHSVTGEAPDTLAVVPPMTLRAPAADRAPAVSSETTADASAEPAPQPDSTHDPVPLEAAAPEVPPAAPVQSLHWETDVAALPIAFDDFDESLAGAVTEQAEPPFPSKTVEEEHWRALAEQVSMQVLQRIDLFTDTGLKEQLAERLRPSVERASAELVGAVTEHVGKLLRTYVAEAIEKEIAQWRRDH